MRETYLASLRDSLGFESSSAAVCSPEAMRNASIALVVGTKRVFLDGDEQAQRDSVYMRRSSERDERGHGPVRRMFERKHGWLKFAGANRVTSSLRRQQRPGYALPAPPAHWPSETNRAFLL